MNAAVGLPVLLEAELDALTAVPHFAGGISQWSRANAREPEEQGWSGRRCGTAGDRPITGVVEWPDYSITDPQAHGRPACGRASLGSRVMS